MTHLHTNWLVPDYCLTTAEVLYRLPDYPNLLQSFIWQTMDTAPEFPSIRRFLSHWEENLDGRIHSVKLASKSLVRPAEFRRVDSMWTLH